MNSAFTRRGKAGWRSTSGPTRKHPVVAEPVDERDAVRISHGDAGDFEIASRRPRVSAGWAGRPAEAWGFSSPSRIGRPHVDPHARDLAVGQFEVEDEHAAPGFDLQPVLPGDAMIVDVFGDAPHAVAAHFRFAAVGVEHPHAGIGLFGRADQNQPVRADPLVPVGNGDRQPRNVSRDGFREAIDVDVVISRPVHLGEFHG